MFKEFAENNPGRWLRYRIVFLRIWIVYLRLLSNILLRRKAILLYAFFCLTIIASIFVHLKLNSYAFDDAYIHIRIIDNFLESGFPYFNQGEAIKVSSSTGWILYVSIISTILQFVGIQLPLPTVVAISNSVTIILGAIVFTKLLSRLSLHQNSWILSSSFFIVYLGICINSSIGLMETPTALLIVGIAFMELIRKRKIAIILFSLAVFFRVELIILLVLIIMYTKARGYFSLKEFIMYISLGLVPVILFDLFFFNTIIPHTVYAKSQIYNLSYLETLLILIDHMKSKSLLLSHYPKLNQFSVIYYLYFPIAIFGMFILRYTRIRKRDLTREFEICLLILIWGFSTLIAYLARQVFLFQWYIPLFLIPIIFCGGYLLSISRRQNIYKFLLVLASPLLIFQMIRLTELLPSIIINPAYYENFSEGARVKQYIHIGRDLNKLYPKAKFMTSEIGGLGYGFDGNIVDAGGLASPEALQFHPMDVPQERSSGRLGAIPVDFVYNKNPDIIVSYDIFIESLLKSDVINRFEIQVYPLFLEEDRENAVISMPYGNIVRSLWEIESLYVLVHRDFDPNVD